MFDKRSPILTQIVTQFVKQTTVGYVPKVLRDICQKSLDDEQKRNPLIISLINFVVFMVTVATEDII